MIQKIIDYLAKFFRINQNKKETTKTSTDDIYPMW